MSENKPASVVDLSFLKKYNPKSFDKFVLPQRIRDYFPNGEIIKNQLLHGSSGVGKSSLLKFLAGKGAYYVNASRDGSIDSLREGGDLSDYCGSISFDSTEKKIVFFDEIDGCSKQFFDALKGFMDSYLGTVIFVATTNHLSKIPSENISRFGEPICFDFLNETEREDHFIKYRNRIFNIARTEGITSTEKSISTFCRSYHPDFRLALESLQTLKHRGVTVIDDSVITKERFEYNKLYDLILGKLDTDTMHKVCTSMPSPDQCVKDIDNNLYEYLSTHTPEKKLKYGNAIIKITEHNNMLNNRVDPLLVLKSLVFVLNQILGN